MSLKPKQVDFNTVWNGIMETVQAVITLGNVKREVWNDTFCDIYTLCVAYPEPLADRLYYETRLLLENHVQFVLKTKVATTVSETDGANQENSLLFRYYRAWIEFNKGVQYLNHLYLYLNQQHIKKQKLSEAEMVYGNSPNEYQEQMEVGELGLDIWKHHMVDHIKSELVKQILDAIHADRTTGEIDTKTAGVVHDVIHSFVLVQYYQKKQKLHHYQSNFETAMLEASAEYYKSQASQLLQTCTVSQYMEEVIKKLGEESRRATKFMHVSSIPKLRLVFEENMITNHLEFLYSENFVATERRTDMKHLYILLKPIPDALKNLIQTFLDHIKNEGIEVISTMKGENIHVQFVENLLQVYHKYEEMISNIFNNDPLFLSALDKACSNVINKRLSDKQPCRSAELVAKYCDSLLKKSKTTEGEIETKLAQSITIFKYVEDKDVYQKFYSRMLAKRLIHEQSQSMDAEEGMINRLKQVCGYEYTSKLHRMFTDISVSTDLNTKFNEFLNTRNKSLGINLSIKILQQGAWPLGPAQTSIPFSVPRQFEAAINLFEKFYSDSFSGRKLTWLHHLCHSELKLSYLKKSYIVIMQTFQMAILLLFETCDSLTCKEIQESLQLNAETFQKHIQSLIESKLLIGSSETLGDNTEIKLNLDYSNKRTKFKITAALQKETQQEVEHTMTAVDEDRKMYLQAAIVRIMKSRKVLRHNALIQEILSQSKVSFSPSIQMIKKCIESLIDKQYIERAANSGDEYSYVA